MKHVFINTSNCNPDFSTPAISCQSHRKGLKCYSDGSLCRFNANVLLSCRDTHAHSHIPPVPANCKCWGVECWCMHIRSHTAVKLPVKRPEEHCSQALAAALPHQSELTLMPPRILKKSFKEGLASFLHNEFEKGTPCINTPTLPPTLSLPSYRERRIT